MRTFFYHVLWTFIFLSCNNIQISQQRLDCSEDCKNPDYTNPRYKPQECKEKCSDDDMADENSGENIENLVQNVEQLKILVIVLLVLVLILFLFVVMILTRNLVLCPTVTMLMKKGKKEMDYEKGKDVMTINDIGRRTNYSVENSPYTNQAPQRTSSVKTNPLPPVHMQSEIRPRKRMPSESTCPDDSQMEGFDNLGLSSSTLNFHSRSGSPISPNTSSPSSPNLEGGGSSLATMNTTMTTIRLDSSIT